MRGVQVKNDIEVEKEYSREEKNGETEPPMAWMQNNDLIYSEKANDGKIFPMLASSKRVANSSAHGMKTDKHFQKALSNLFESTPNRDDKASSVRSEDQSIAHPFGDGTPRYETESNGLGMYNRSLNQNMREYLNDHYDRDRKSLFSFYTGLKGHDKNETALWGETNKELVGGLDGSALLGTTITKENINYNYMVVPFRNDRERSIFKYQPDVQDASEMELTLLHKKRRTSKDGELKLKVGLTDNVYFNKNILEASWNDFFFKARPQPRKEKEYSLVLIDLNDKSVFYDRIHPFIFGVQKASKKNIADDLPDPVMNIDPQNEDNKVLLDIDTANNEFATSGLKPLTGTLPAPSETDSISISKKGRWTRLEVEEESQEAQNYCS